MNTRQATRKEVRTFLVECGCDVVIQRNGVVRVRRITSQKSPWREDWEAFHTVNDYIIVSHPDGDYIIDKKSHARNEAIRNGHIGMEIA